MAWQPLKAIRIIANFMHSDQTTDLAETKNAPQQLREGGGDMAFRVVEIQETPNPNARKFVLDRPISEQPTSFFNSDAAKGHPLASRLFQVPGVATVLLLGDFVTINKRPDATWAEIAEKVKKTLVAEAD